MIFLFCKYKKRTLKMSTTPYKIITRTMLGMTTRSQYVNTVSRTLLTKTNTNKPFFYTPQKNASYEVDNHNVNNTNHKQSQENVVIQRNNGQVFQHSSFTRVTCAQDNCIHKLCEKPCVPAVERADVGFATHNGTLTPDHKYLASTDLKGDEKRPQYGKMYPKPIRSYDQLGDHKDSEKTHALNTNKEMLDNLHMNTSREPTAHD